MRARPYTYVPGDQYVRTDTMLRTYVQLFPP